MELNHDWRGFRAVFQPRRRGAPRALPNGPTGDGAAYLVVDGQMIIAANGAPGEDLRDWIGQTVSLVMEENPNRELVVFDRREADSRLGQCASMPHFYDQAEYLRTQSVPHTSVTVSAAAGKKLRKYQPPAPGHFLLNAVQGWWAKILPSAYGLFIRMEGPTGATVANPTNDHPEEVFVLVRRGRLELFHSPDLSSMGSDRVRQPAAVVKYLSEKHGVPVQGLFVLGKDWAEWSDPAQAGEAWRSLALAIQNHEAQLVPFRWQIMTLVATRAFLGI